MSNPLRTIAWATLATTLFAAAPSAVADHGGTGPWVPGYEDSATLGVFLGVGFDARVRLVYGLDIRIGAGQVGGVIRLEAHGIRRVKLVGAVTAVTARGENQAEATRFQGELGVALRTGYEEFGERVVGHAAGSVSGEDLIGGARLFAALPFVGSAERYAFDAGLQVWTAPANL